MGKSAAPTVEDDLTPEQIARGLKRLRQAQEEFDRHAVRAKVGDGLYVLYDPRDAETGDFGIISFDRAPGTPEPSSDAEIGRLMRAAGRVLERVANRAPTDLLRALRVPARMDRRSRGGRERRSRRTRSSSRGSPGRQDPPEPELPRVALRFGRAA